MDFPPQISSSIGAFRLQLPPTEKPLFRGNAGGGWAKWGEGKWLLQQQKKLGQAAGAPVNCFSEAAGLGEFPRALVCTGEGQLLGLSAAAASLCCCCCPHAVASLWGCVQADAATHGLGCPGTGWEGAVE